MKPVAFCLEDEELAAYAADELGPERRARTQAHLDDCAACFVGLIAVMREQRDGTRPIGRKPTGRVPAAGTSGAFRRRRWTTLFGLPLVGFAATLAIFASFGGDEPGPPCDDPRGHIEAAWSAEQRASMSRDGAGAALAAQLDSEADTWSRAAEESCIAGAEPAVALRLQCLDEQRVRLAAFAQVALTRHSGDARERLEGARWLADPGWCAGLELLPTDGLRAPTLAMRGELAHLQGVALAGERERAIEGIGVLERRARELGLRGLEAELLLARGRVEADADRLELAAIALLAASNTAEAARADATVAEAMLALVEITARRGDLVRAREYADRTAAAIERVGVPDRRLDGRLAVARAMVEIHAGEDARAESGLQAAATLLPPDDPARVDALAELARVQARRGDARGAIATTTRVLEAQTERLGEQHPLVALVRLELARHRRATGDREGALLELHRGLPVALRSLGARSAPVGQLLDLRGELLRELGHNDEAIEHFRRARRILAPLFGEHHELVEATLAHEALALAE